MKNHVLPKTFFHFEEFGQSGAYFLMQKYCNNIDPIRKKPYNESVYNAGRNDFMRSF